MKFQDFPDGSDGLSTMQETWVRSLGGEDLLEKEMETHSSTLAWKIPWMEEPGRLHPMGSQSRTRLSDVNVNVNVVLLKLTPYSKSTLLQLKTTPWNLFG